ncbi:MAG: tetratricopeptide repeat protein [bacterium]
MAQRRNTSILIIIIVLVLFGVRWKMDDFVCNPSTWHSYTQMDKKGHWVAWRPAPKEGRDFFSAVFTGGGGSPAVFAMLGGQRSMVGNILWDYSDTLFHKGKPYDMVPVLESCVTLNPSFTEAWSLYAWHLGWNLYIYTPDQAMRARRLREAESVYQRAIAANPEKPGPRLDIAWFYTQRRGDYESARKYLEPVIYGKNDDGTPLFTMMTINDANKPDWQKDTLWAPDQYGRRLAMIYLKIGVLDPHPLGNQAMLQKALDTYKLVNASMPADKQDSVSITKIEQLTKGMNDIVWVSKERQLELDHQRVFGFDQAMANPIEKHGNEAAPAAE